MTKEFELELQIGANLDFELLLDSEQSGRTHRADIRASVGDVFVQLHFETGDGISATGNAITLTKNAIQTGELSLDTDSAHWVIDIESVGETESDVRREARGLVLVTRDVTRLSEPTAAANASKLLTYSLTDGQTLTNEEQDALLIKIGASGGGSVGAVRYDVVQSLTSPEKAQALTNQGVTAAGQAVAQSANASAQRAAMELGTLATQSGTFSGTSSGTNTGDQTNISGNSATVTTNANLTGHVISSGNATTLGSFTLAQLNTAISDAELAEIAIGSAVSGATSGAILYTIAGVLNNSSDLKIRNVNMGFGAAPAITGTFSYSGAMVPIAAGFMFSRADRAYPSLAVGDYGVGVHRGVYLTQESGSGYWFSTNAADLLDSAVIGITRATNGKLKISLVAGGVGSLDLDTLYVKTYTLAALNSAYPSPTSGQKSFITDELAGVFGAICIGGGGLERPVFFGNGAWRNG